MKQGKTITELAQELERQSSVKRDYAADTSLIVMGDDSELNLDMGRDGMIPLAVNGNCHSQIASRLKIPKGYYDRMLYESPYLLANNVNHWLKNNPETRLIRTLDGQARAFLSDRYRCLDNIDLMGAVLPVLLNEMKTEFLSCEVTEDRLYLKVMFPELESEVTGSTLKNDVVKAGIVISNSEVGNGSLRVEPLIYRLVCTNGMIANTSMKKYHVGRTTTDLEQVQELFRDETKELTDRAFWMQVQDVVRGSVSRDIFQAHVDRLSETTRQKIEGNPVKAIEVVTKQFQLTSEHNSSILRNLIEDGDLSRWGVANAVTRLANEQADYEAATRLEKIGGKIIDLGERDWMLIAKAA